MHLRHHGVSRTHRRLPPVLKTRTRDKGLTERNGEGGCKTQTPNGHNMQSARKALTGLVTPGTSVAAGRLDRGRPGAWKARVSGCAWVCRWRPRTVSGKMGPGPVKEAQTLQFGGSQELRLLYHEKKGSRQPPGQTLEVATLAKIAPQSLNLCNRGVNVNSASCWKAPALQHLCAARQKPQVRELAVFWNVQAGITPFNSYYCCCCCCCFYLFFLRFIYS